MQPSRVSKTRRITPDTPGQLGPHSIEAEESTLGSVLYDDRVLPDIRRILTVPNPFFELKHNWIYAAMLELYDAGSAVDNMTIVEQLRQDGKLDDIGGSAYITYLLNNTETALHAESYAAVVQRAAIRRRGMDFSGTSAQAFRAEEKPVDEIISDVYRDFLRIAEWATPGGIVSAASLLDQAWANFEHNVTHPADMRGMSSGITRLDQILCGFRPGLYSILGDTSMGKSTLASGLVWEFAQQGPGLYVPTETMGVAAMEKMWMDQTGVPFKAYQRGDMTEEQIQKATDKFAVMNRCADNIQVLNSPKPTIEAIQAFAAAGRCKWILVDSGTVMSKGARGDSDLRMATTLVSQGLQEVARGGIVVVATWQIGRAVKERASKRPTLHDAKESGAIEEDSDVVMAVYRHDYYTTRGEAPEDPKFPPNSTKLYILKDRWGGAGDEEVTLRFIPGRGFFEVGDENGRPL